MVAPNDDRRCHLVGLQQDSVGRLLRQSVACRCHRHVHTTCRSFRDLSTRQGLWHVLRTWPPSAHAVDTEPMSAHGCPVHGHTRCAPRAGDKLARGPLPGITTGTDGRQSEQLRPIRNWNTVRTQREVQPQAAGRHPKAVSCRRTTVSEVGRRQESASRRHTSLVSSRTWHNDNQICRTVRRGWRRPA